jgi:hypothetical protein
MVSISKNSEFGRKLDSQFANRRAPQDAIDVDARLPEPRAQRYAMEKLPASPKPVRRPQQA